MAHSRSILKLQGHDLHTGWLLCPYARNVRGAGVTRPPLVQVGEVLSRSMFCGGLNLCMTMWLMNAFCKY